MENLKGIESFLKQIENKEKTTKDFLLLLLEEKGIFLGKLYKAKANLNSFYSKQGHDSILEENKNNNILLEDIVDFDGNQRKYIRRLNKQPQKYVAVQKGDVGMFIDLDCEAITTGSMFVSLKFLVKEKVINVAYDYMFMSDIFPYTNKGNKKKSEYSLIEDEYSDDILDNMLFNALSGWQSINP